MNFLLKSKHWLIFILSFGIPFLAYILMMVNMFSIMTPMIENMEQNPNPMELQAMMQNQFSWMPLIMILFMVVTYGWQYAVTINFQEKIPESLRINITRFKIFFTIPVIYILVISIGMQWMFSQIFAPNFNPDSINPNGLFTFMPIFFILHIFSMFCIFYTMFMTAKSIKLAETKKNVTFGDFIGEFFLIWFFFIGVWILQPKVNKIQEEDPYQEDEPLKLEDNLVF